MQGAALYGTRKFPRVESDRHVGSLDRYGRNVLMRIICSLVPLLILAGCAPFHRVQESASLAAFRNDAELSAYLQHWAQRRTEWIKKDTRRRQREWEKAHRSSLCGPAKPTSTAVVSKRWKSATRQGATHSLLVKGHTRQPSGAALIAGNVVTRNPVSGTTSAEDGSYRLNVIKSDSTNLSVLVRRIGYMPTTVSIDPVGVDSVEIDFRLCGDVMRLEQAVVTGASTAGESITNTQHEGVDEGGIVKVHGDHLVILRRGRLYAVAIGDDRLASVSSIDAFAPGIDPQHAWYDELLVSGDKIVVVGYSYERGGTEIGIFSIDSRGSLTHKGTYHVRSNDYYSSRNYASRLVGTKLVFYEPLQLNDNPATVEKSLPSMRKWEKGAGKGEFRTIASPRRVYRPVSPLDPSAPATLHSVLSCDLATVELTCEADVVIGAPGRVFYVSPTAVYVWVDAHSARPRTINGGATVYRIPLNGSPASAIGAQGNPLDQFSFFEGRDERLNVFVLAEGAGDAMWRAEWRQGDAALLQVPLAKFGNGKWEAPQSAYRVLPRVTDLVLHNRFVDGNLLYGSGNGWGPQNTNSSVLQIVPLNGNAVTQLRLPHGIDRIEPLGTEAMVIGSGEADLHFTGIQLEGVPSISKQFIRKDASQGELRSHGFFYKSDGPRTGIMGLPIRRAGQPGYEHLFEGSASVLFIQNGDSLRYSGELAAVDGGVRDDHCVASCVDWYGNARPIFFGSRIFALMGYELVEGKFRDGKLEERRRIDFR